jgi:hypothetical protein
MTTELDVLARILDGEVVDTDEGRAIAADLERIREGMSLAARSPHPPRAHYSMPVVGVAAGIAVVAIAAGVVLASDDRGPREAAAPPPATASAVTTAPEVTSTAATQTGPVLGLPGAPLRLAERVAQADRIVVGEVTNVTRGALSEDVGGLPYLLASVKVTESLKPAGGTDAVVAFDYDLGGAVTSEGSARPWTVGQRVLLFLVSDAGTVSEKIEPAHLQLAEGDGGRFLFNGETLDAPFSLDDVRRLVTGS